MQIRLFLFRNYLMKAEEKEFKLNFNFNFKSNQISTAKPIAFSF